MKRRNIIILLILSIFTTVYGCVMVYQEMQADAGHLAIVGTPEGKDVH